MPFGTMLPFTQTYGGENSYQHPTLSNPSKKRFTSYDRSDATGLDYAVNRHYSPQQGRFTQVDPIGMGAVSLSDPQTLNLYAYCGNDPINHVDPAGTSFFGKLFGWIGKAFKWAFRVAAVIVAVIAVVAAFSVGQYWGSILITKGVVAMLFGSSALLATAGWAPGKIGQIAGAIITAGLSWGSNFRTPTTFPHGTGVGSVSNFLAQQQNEYSKERVEKGIGRLLEIINLTKTKIEGGGQLLNTIRENNRSGLDNNIVICQAAIESGMTPKGIVGAQGELGLFQIKLRTANSLGEGRFTQDQVLNDPALNTRLGTKHLGQLYGRFGNVREALGAYKQGEFGVANNGLTVASQEYADRVIGCAERLGKQ